MYAGEVADAIAAMGKFDVDMLPRTVDLYKPILRSTHAREFRLIKDASYGPHDLHKIDVYMPKRGSARQLPIVIFFHQGGFISGDKNEGDDLFYSNVGRFFAANGVVAVLANFRLPPEGVWPAGAEDVGRCLDWVRGHAGDFTGDPDQIFLFGHSSGATHVADYALRASRSQGSFAECCGLILMSGRYRLPPVDPDIQIIHNFGRPKIASYYGPDPILYASRQILGNVKHNHPPVFLLVAEFDHYVFELNTIDLLSELAVKSSRTPRFRQVRGHNHMSQILQIGTEHDSLGADLLDFVLKGRQASPWQRLTLNYR
jgi:acetyl esterase